MGKRNKSNAKSKTSNKASLFHFSLNLENNPEEHIIFFEMANPVFEEELGGKVNTSKILVVGAGGIGCELLKNLVLTGFKDITVIDLDTIDVTNLNRQFLFQKQHVGKPKSVIARESVLGFVPDAKVEAIHDTIFNPDYGVTFFKKFQMVLNALDNRTARSHVNRMCLAANIPLVESGTAGYLGQVTVIKKGVECYECTPKPHQKTFPGCTIRNTPSEPIHCIVWAKHLFNQLFGESDPDEDVSPDSEDPELGNSQTEETGNVTRISTRQWVMDQNYNAKAIFTKLFHDDIKLLLSMDKLWEKKERKKPTPLVWDELSDEVEEASEGAIADQVAWSIKKCAQVLESSINKLEATYKASDYKDHLVWDKDDEAAMDFVAACANIRAYVYKIPQKTRFDIKSMAGNIIPAIATTNAVIAGGIVMEALKILNGQEDKCRTTYLTKKPNPRKKILVPCELNKPIPNCYVCSEKREIGVKLDIEKVTLKTLEDKILKGALMMVAPDAETTNGKIIISSEEPMEESFGKKTLKDMELADGSILSCDDFLQDYNVKVILYHSTELKDGVEFELVGDISKLKPDEEENGHKNGKNGAETNGSVKNGEESNGDRKRKTEGEEEIPSKKAKVDEDEDDDIVCVEDPNPVKKAKITPKAAEPSKEDDDIVCLE